jgi:hypothetical protein
MRTADDSTSCGSSATPGATQRCDFFTVIDHTDSYVTSASSSIHQKATPPPLTAQANLIYILAKKSMLDFGVKCGIWGVVYSVPHQALKTRLSHGLTKWYFLWSFYTEILFKFHGVREVVAGGVVKIAASSLYHQLPTHNSNKNPVSAMHSFRPPL